MKFIPKVIRINIESIMDVFMVVTGWVLSIYLMYSAKSIDDVRYAMGLVLMLITIDYVYSTS